MQAKDKEEDRDSIGTAIKEKNTSLQTQPVIPVTGTRRGHFLSPLKPLHGSSGVKPKKGKGMERPVGPAMEQDNRTVGPAMEQDNRTVGPAMEQDSRPCCGAGQ